MIYIIIPALVFTFGLVVWNLLHVAPRGVAMFLPDRLCLIIGAIMLPFGVFSAFVAAFIQQNAEGMIASMAFAYVGFWFLLIKPAASGGYETMFMIRRLFAMVGVLMAALVVILYLGESKAVAAVNLVLVAAGLWFTTNFLRHLDRGR